MPSWPLMPKVTGTGWLGLGSCHIDCYLKLPSKEHPVSVPVLVDLSAGVWGTGVGEASDGVSADRWGRRFVYLTTLW